MSDNDSKLSTFRSHPHFLQSDAWGRFQEGQGNAVITARGEGWSYLAVEEHGKLGSRLYCPYGPTADSAEALAEAIENLEREAKERGVDFIRVEPRLEIDEDTLRSMGLQRSHHDVQPRDTVVNVVDEKVTDRDQLFSLLKSSQRRQVRKGEKKGVTYRTSYDVEELRHFLAMIHEVSERTGMKPHEDEYFESIAKSLFPNQDAGLMFAELDGEPIGAIIFYSDGLTMSYAHAANFAEYRNLSAGSGLMMHAIWEANRTGHQFFDTYGVAPEDAEPDHPWAGFTTFKQTFGGDRVRVAGTWEKPIKKLKYRVYHALASRMENRE